MTRTDEEITAPSSGWTAPSRRRWTGRSGSASGSPYAAGGAGPPAPAWPPWWWSAVVGGVALTRSGDDGNGAQVAVDQPSGPPVSTLVMTRPDGSTYSFDDVTVSCDAPKVSGSRGRVRSRTIWTFSPIEFTVKDDAGPSEPFLYFDGIWSTGRGRPDLHLPERLGDRRLGRTTRWSCSSPTARATPSAATRSSSAEQGRRRHRAGPRGVLLADAGPAARGRHDPRQRGQAAAADVAGTLR